jgi:RecA-family ATPase
MSKCMDANDELMAGKLSTIFKPLVLEETGLGETVANLWTSVGDASDADGSCWLGDPPDPRTYLLSTPPEADGFDIDESRGVLPLGKVGMLAAAGGVGKSWALTQLAISVATGTQWLGAYDVTAPGHVLLALGEEERLEVRRRLYYAGKAAKLTAQQVELVKERIIFLPLCGKPVCITQQPGAQGAATKPGADFGDAAETVFSDVLRKRLTNSGHAWRLVVFDPRSRFAGLDAETDNAAATRFVQALERFAEVPGNPTVLVAHHTNKNSRAPGADAGAGAARGSSALTDGVRWQANLEPLEMTDSDGRRLVEFRVTKTNYGLYPGPVTLTRDPDHRGAMRAVSTEEHLKCLEAREAAAEEAAIDKAVKKKEQAAKAKERFADIALDEAANEDMEDSAQAHQEDPIMEEVEL